MPCSQYLRQGTKWCNLLFLLNANCTHSIGERFNMMKRFFFRFSAWKSHFATLESMNAGVWQVWCLWMSVTYRRAQTLTKIQTKSTTKTHVNREQFKNLLQQNIHLTYPLYWRNVLSYITHHSNRLILLCCIYSMRLMKCGSLPFAPKHTHTIQNISVFPMIYIQFIYQYKVIFSVFDIYSFKIG